MDGQVNLARTACLEVPLHVFRGAIYRIRIKPLELMTHWRTTARCRLPQEEAARRSAEEAARKSEAEAAAAAAGKGKKRRKAKHKKKASAGVKEDL